MSGSSLLKVHPISYAFFLSLFLRLVPGLGYGSLHLVVPIIVHLLHQLHQALPGVSLVIQVRLMSREESEAIFVVDGHISRIPGLHLEN